MYGEAEHRPAIERWWAGLARHLREAGVPGVPDTLTWPDDYHGHWRSPDLLLSQTCGYPFVNVLGPAVKLVATPRYDAPGCEGARYGAHVIVPEGCGGAERRRPAGLPAGHQRHGLLFGLPRLAPHAARRRRPAVLLRRDRHDRRPPRQRPPRRGRRSGRLRGRLRHPRPARTAPGGVERHPNPAVIANGAGDPVRDQAATPAEDAAKLRDGLRAAFADPSLAPARKALRLASLSVLADEDYQSAFRD